MSVNPVKNPLTLKVPPVLFVNVATPLFGLYVPPVTNISSGNPKYVDADIVNALKDCVNNVFPLTVPPLNGRYSPVAEPLLKILQSDIVFDHGAAFNL
jgi:hypothetical protein